MTSVQTAALVSALITLFGAVQAWLVSRTYQHGKQLNGLMGPRITAGANAAIQADHLNRAEAIPSTLSVANQTRIAALEAELATLKAPPIG
jgi:hypothetical protein